ncbi:hypothetical protein EDB19DRAFT_1735133 [Suillus lakei]|nr:hypothetical protein EDB19DRAFT_1735133 [Suillus lakei]
MNIPLHTVYTFLLLLPEPLQDACCTTWISTPVIQHLYSHALATRHQRPSTLSARRQDTPTIVDILTTRACYILNINGHRACW